MKTLNYFIYILITLTACSITPTETETLLYLTKASYETSNIYAVNKQQALSLIDTSNFSDCNILISKDIVSPNTKVINVTNSHSPNFESWLVFVDLYPNAYWAHDCICYYVDVITGEVTSSNHRFPPIISMDTIKCINPKSSTSQRNLKTISCVEEQNSRTEPDSTKWAVIMGGTYTGGFNAISIWTECSEIYRMLRNLYSYPEDQIKILYTNSGMGSDFNLDGHNENIIDFTSVKVNSVFDTLSTQLSIGDTLSIFVMTHGETRGNNQSGIILFDGSYYSDSEFATQINNIPSNIPINVIMGQCYSGGFIDNLYIRCKYIATACSADEKAWEATSILRSEFYRHWLTAMNCFNATSPNTNIDTDNNKIITFGEAFAYADSEDAKDEHTPSEVETRQEAPNPIDYKETYGLSKILPSQTVQEPVLNPVIIGPQNLRVGDIVTYRLANIPEGATVVDWSYPDQLFTILSEFTPSNSDYSILTLVANEASVSTVNLSVSATLSLSTSDTTEIISNGINIWKSGINISDDLMVGELSSSGGTVQLVSDFEGASGYNWHNDIGWSVVTQGLHYAVFTNLSRDDNQYVTISVDFTNPFGDQTTFVKTFTLNQ